MSGDRSKKPEKRQIELHKIYLFSQTLTGFLGSIVYVLCLGSLSLCSIGTSNLDAPSTKCSDSKSFCRRSRFHPHSRGFYQELNCLGKHTGPGCLTNTYKSYTSVKIPKSDKLWFPRSQPASHSVGRSVALSHLIK